MKWLGGFCIWFAGLLGWAAAWQELPGGRWTSLSAPAEGRPGFTLLSPETTSVVFTNKLRAADGAQNRTFYNGSGVAAGDFDGDGLPDIALVGIEGRLSLYRNLGAWRFTNVTAASGAVATNLMARGVVLADITGDGALDLLISANGAGVHCWRNDGRGHFTDITTTAGIIGKRGSLSMTLGDVDGDGTLDLYVVNNRTDDIRDRGAGQVQLRMVNGQLTVPDNYTNRLGVSSTGKIFEYGEPDELWLNDGPGRFRVASWTDGRFLDESGQPLKGPPLDWGLAGTFRDLNGDGAPDLYICNDYWTPDRLWINDGRGRFRAAAKLALRQTSGSSMGVDVADINLDGHPDFFVVDMLSRDVAWRKRQMPAQSDYVNQPGQIEERPQSLRNTLQLARGDGTYAEIAEFAALSASEWAWQPVFLDVDLDGYPDLLVTTGHMRDVQDRDAAVIVESRERNYGEIANAAERRRLFVADRVANLSVYQPLNTPIVSFRNRGNLTFEDMTERWGTDQLGVHHGLAVADFDGDGDLDFAVNNLNGPAALYRNDCPAGRVAVRLKGRAPNTQAIGAVVTLRGGAVPAQRLETISGGRYLSGGDPLLTFATGTNRTGMTLEVRWRNGTRREITGIEAGRLYELQEDPTLDKPMAPTAAPAVAPWFEDKTTTLNHSHQETLHEDFERQRLLTRRLSQKGPGVAWMDWDGDGWEDLAVGGGAGSTLAVLLNDRRGGFGASTNFLAARDQVGLAVSGRQLFVAESNYEDGRAAGPAIRMLEAGKPAVSVVNASTNVIGALALADWDGDGDVDLFVGNGFVPGRWPEPVDSWLLQREPNGGVTTNLLQRFGTVNSALWCDLQDDGFSELAVANEWGSISLQRNTAGKFSAWDPNVLLPTEAGVKTLPLSQLTGWWMGLGAGDFDGDGRMDLIAANWGLNSEHHASLEHPAVLVAGDWSGDGVLGLIETVLDRQRGSLTPLRSLPELLNGLSFLEGKFATHRAYSEATLEDVIRLHPAKAQVFKAVELRSLVLLNRGDQFEARPLPLAAQFAPAFTPVVADFNGDGREDVFLSQNYFATRPGVPRLDAGRGLLLAGDGRGGFQSVDGTESGVMIYGEQRGAATADFDQDGRADLVVTQNGAATRLYRNQHATPGVRVRLVGPPGNPDGVGAVARAKRGEILGPAREWHGGYGTGSQDGAVQVISMRLGETNANEVVVRWPGGGRQTVAIAADAREVTVRWSPSR